MTLASWSSLLLVCVLGALSPGPSLAIVAKHCLGGGRRHGLLTSWTHALGVGCYALITVMGLGVLLAHHPLWFRGISYLGAAYLMWLGVKAIRSHAGGVSRLQKAEQSSLWDAGWDGLLMSLTNPKLILFFIALFSQFVSASDPWQTRIILVVTPWLIDGLWYSLVTLLLSHPRVLPSLRSHAVWIERCCGVLLMLVALRVVWPI